MRKFWISIPEPIRDIMIALVVSFGAILLFSAIK
jgi:hypothetical protein